MALAGRTAGTLLASPQHRLSSLRGQLETASDPRILCADRAFVRLAPGAVTTDIAEVTSSIDDAAQAKDPVERARRLEQALTLYAGEFLPGHYDTWVLREREWLAEGYFRALREWLPAATAAGERAALSRLGEAERLVAFFRGWVCKEAFVKATGAGLSQAPNDVEIDVDPGRPARLLSVNDDTGIGLRWSLQEIRTAPDTVAAVVVEGKPARLKQTSVSIS